MKQEQIAEHKSKIRQSISNIKMKTIAVNYDKASHTIETSVVSQKIKELNNLKTI